MKKFNITIYQSEIDQWTMLRIIHDENDKFVKAVFFSSSFPFMSKNPTIDEIVEINKKITWKTIDSFNVEL